MGFSVGVAGKGGVGKTTLSGLLVRHMITTGHKPVLAIDADPNSNLNEVLALEVAGTLGDISQEVVEDGVPTGMSKHDFLLYRAEQCLVESKGFDLLAMGRPEGPGCYCFTNNVLRDVVNRMCDQYPFLVIDNEAGMEHLSRRIMRRIDRFIIVSDPTIRGLQAAGRIHRIMTQLEFETGQVGLIVNRVHNGLSPALNAQIESIGVPLIATINEDPAVREFDSEGRPLLELPDDGPMVTAVAEIAARIGLGAEK
jgi:CO dehydrogenase maturation factor